MSPSSWGTVAGIGTISPAAWTIRVEGGPALDELASSSPIASNAARASRIRPSFSAVATTASLIGRRGRPLENRKPAVGFAPGMPTVREASFELFREQGMTTMFGNPGSTELPMLAEFPSDFRYVL